MGEEIWTTINGHLLDCAHVRSWDWDYVGPSDECDCGAIDDWDDEEMEP